MSRARGGTLALFGEAWSRLWRVPTIVTAGLSATVALALGRLTIAQGSKATAPLLVPTVLALAAGAHWLLIGAWLAAAFSCWLGVAWMRGASARATSDPGAGTRSSLGVSLRLLPRYLWLQVALSVTAVVVELPGGTLRGLRLFELPDAIGASAILLQVFSSLGSLIFGVVALVVAFCIRDVVVAGRRARLRDGWSRFARYLVPLVLAELALAPIVLLVLGLSVAGSNLLGLGARIGFLLVLWAVWFASWAWTESFVTACWLDGEAQVRDADGAPASATPASRAEEVSLA